MRPSIPPPPPPSDPITAVSHTLSGPTSLCSWRANTKLANGWINCRAQREMPVANPADGQRVRAGGWATRVLCPLWSAALSGRVHKRLCQLYRVLSPPLKSTRLLTQGGSQDTPVEVSSAPWGVPVQGVRPGVLSASTRVAHTSPCWVNRSTDSCIRVRANTSTSWHSESKPVTEHSFPVK